MDRILLELQKQNPSLEIQDVFQPDFARFGRVHPRIRPGSALDYARVHALPQNGVAYEPSIPGLEADADFIKSITQEIFGDMPVEIGWVYGHNTDLGGLEYHKSSEALAAVTDLVVLLGSFQEIRWSPTPKFDSSTVKAFYVPAETTLEIYPLTLHFAPLSVDRQTGFCALVGLPTWTNLPLDEFPSKTGENILLFGRNKWLLVHPEAADLVQQGAYAGITGPNLRINPL
jgi:hypothetical protein